MATITREMVDAAIEAEKYPPRPVDPDAFLDAIVSQFEYDWTPGDWDRWRHGGWYVGNLRYPSGAVGCVSNNYADKKWRIACDPRPFEQQPTFKNRTDAAIGERALIASQIIDANAVQL